MASKNLYALNMSTCEKGFQKKKRRWIVRSLITRPSGQLGPWYTERFKSNSKWSPIKNFSVKIVRTENFSSETSILLKKIQKTCHFGLLGRFLQKTALKN
jgi:hypothetical protein